MGSEERYYITTTIPYVNGRPHIGHALEFVQTDVFGRFRRLRGDDVYVLTGTDENALKNVQAAERDGIPVEELVEKNSQRFKDLASRLDLQFDQFIRTSVDPRHAAAAEKIWRAVDQAGDIYKKYYSGLYCVGCELYYSEAELVDGNCPEHGVPPELIEEENYFFRLSRYQEKLHELISTDQLRVIPNHRKNEMLSFISSGLQDFSISRSHQRAKGWGIPVPGDASQVIYVWFDALINYISALDYANEGELYERYWLQNDHRVHALGKGVIRFHVIYWPAMLLSAGVPLPDTEFVHGYINSAGAKMSKSLGNVADPEDLLNRYGADATRYYLLRGVSPTGDANFTYENFEARYTADLANDLGNLLNRTVSMIARYRNGSVPSTVSASRLERTIQNLAQDAIERVPRALVDYDPQSALDAVWELVSRCNKYVEERAPWSLAKRETEGDTGAEHDLSTTLGTLAESLRIVSELLNPLLPSTAGRIREQLGVGEQNDKWQNRLAWGKIVPGSQVARAEPLFPRIEVSTTPPAEAAIPSPT